MILTIMKRTGIMMILILDLMKLLMVMTNQVRMMSKN